MPNALVFIAVCMLAGALAVPVSPVATPFSTLMAGGAGYLGLRAWRWSRLPSATRINGPSGARRVLWLAGAFAVGLAVGLLALAAIRLYIEPTVPAAGARIAAAGTLPIWRRLIIIYVAAVGEELVFRLLMLSLITGVLMRLFDRDAVVPGPRVMVNANALSALAFAAIHLPAWTALGPMSSGLVTAVLMLNSLGGLVFGTVFMRRGIVAAMWAHAGADCAIQLIGPLT